MNFEDKYDDITVDDRDIEKENRITALANYLADVPVKNFVQTVDMEKLLKHDHNLTEHLIDNFTEISRKVKEANGNTIRLKNLFDSETVNIHEIRSKHINKMVNVKGLVRSVSKVMHKTTKIVYHCYGCNMQRAVVSLKNGNCPYCNAASDRYDLQDTFGKDFMYIVIEEDLRDIGNGSDPKSMIILMEDDLCNPELTQKLKAGTKVKVTGIVSVKSKGTKDGSQMFYVNSNYVKHVDESIESINLTPKQVEKVKKIKDPMNTIKDAIFWNIEGMDDIKKAIVLQLVSAKPHKDVRMCLHVLIVSDPGCSKTTMANQTIKYLPGSRFASASTATGVGLIASTEKNEEIGGWVLKYGALPMANKALIALDEFEKLDKRDQTMLNNAMENLMVPIDKGGIHETIETDVSVLAMANPKERTFSPYEATFAQININKELCDRFDLVFAVKAPRTKEEMLKISKKMMFAKKCNKLPDQVIKDYIIYARTKIEPVMSEEVANLIISKYIELFKPVDDERNPGMYTSARAQNSLKRLAVAHAKLRLSDMVEPVDVENAYELIKSSLVSLDVLQPDGIDSFAIEKSTKYSVRDIMKHVTSILSDAKKEVEECDIKDKCNCSDQDFDEALYKLKNSGTVYEPRRGFWKLI